MDHVTTADDRRGDDEAAPPAEVPRPIAAIAQPLSRRGSWILGAVMTTATALVYFIGSGRSVGDIDSSTTVGAFIKTPSLLDDLRRVIPTAPMQFNNHPVFSLVEHAVWSSGLHSEAALRVAPILFGALAVGLLAAECARLFGWLSGLCAGLILAANPLFAFLSREFRGYSLVTLCAVGSTILLRRLLTPDARGRFTEAGYVLVIAAGLATHLWFGLVLVIHLTIILVRRRWDMRWLGRFAAGGILGMLVYARTLSELIRTQKKAPFQTSFPTKSAHFLLGHQAIAALILAVLVIYALMLCIRRTDVLVAIGVVGALLAFVWLVVHPQGLAPRFFIWMVPAAGLAGAIVVSRRPWVAALILVAVVAMIADEHAAWTSASPATAQAAAIVDAARAQGQRVCGYKAGQWAVVAYTRMPPPVQKVGLKNCDVVVEMRLPVGKYERIVQHQLPNTWYIPGSTPVEVFSRIPVATLLAGRTARLSLDAHPHTYP
jgi:hypothetical protein